VIKRYDLAIVGSGFAGSLLAMIARRLGLSVVLLEKFRHPRFAIGESATPLANLFIEELASRYDLPRLLPLSKFGSWQESYPHIACGLKRGFTFFHHRLGEPFRDDSARSNQLLVAASPHDRIADMHWYRPDFDHFLVREAEQYGAEYFDEIELDAPRFDENKVVLTGRRHSQPLSFNVRFLIDATGPRGFIHRALELSEKPFERLPATQGLYTHFRGVRRLDSMSMHPSTETPPYPIDDAAVHHVFDGGWIWVLRFNNGITSAGVAAVDELAHRMQFRKGREAWNRLLLEIPTVAEQFLDSEPEFDFVHSPRLSFHSAVITGERWAMVPSAAGFIDPLLSTGFPLTLLGISRLARALEDDFESNQFRDHLHQYEIQTEHELLTAERLVAALYANMGDFELFTSISLLYFAAASFAEAARRLGRTGLAESFLLHDNPSFGLSSRTCFDQAIRCLSPDEKESLKKQIRHTIEPVNVAGLGKPERRNWYPVNADDLLAAAPKLQADAVDIKQLLRRTGFESRETAF